MNIKGRAVTLRAIEEGDLEYLQKWANDPITQDGIGEQHFPSSMDFHKTWFQALKNDSLNQRFVVEVPDGGVIGVSSLISIDWRNSHAWHGLVLGEESHRGKGYGIDAIMATMRYAFEEMNLQRLDGAMLEYNTLSLSTYCGMKLGWKEEGRRRDYYFRKGRYWDQILVGVTKQDYLTLIDSTKYWDVT
ncbi:GNAT family N-acetyltransferase [Polynucleobacter sp. 71A-WALBACH]|uniref:GNAT family N-acetyltransferase n=1 Tax=Polynucleobacter sp. 71A-WALBACH TaxID=2689097 RepID=UPI001C0B439D|nr:GNAT family protein [Polynucleobacter sp. 71A-WALBACH]MBU3593275.1 GNAT family N-acetyltransferase [Polynucleobacter sp. 71A-WALBACH]